MHNLKYQGGHDRGRSASLDKHPLVLEYDCYGTDVSERGVPVRMVALVPGYAFEGAARNAGDDPDARRALHAQGFETVKDALERLALAEPCKCGGCLARLARRA